VTSFKIAWRVQRKPALDKSRLVQSRLDRWVAFTESPSILLAFGFKNAKPESLGAAFFECLDLPVHLLDRIFMLWRRRF